MTISFRYEYRGLCREAMTFYCKALGFEVKTLTTYGEHNNLGIPLSPEQSQLVHSAELVHPSGCRLFMCDSISLLFSPDPIMEINEGHISQMGCICGAPFEISGLNESEITGLYEMLVENQSIVHIPLGPGNGHKLYASVMDRYNLNWNLSC